MTAIERQAEDFVVDARLLAEAFGLTEDDVRRRMRDGAITSRCETGVDADAGRWRLTFHHGDRACRFVVDDAGAVLKRTLFPHRPRPQQAPVDDDGAGATPADRDAGA